MLLYLTLCYCMAYACVTLFFITGRSYSYFVEVSLSMDGSWHRVVDYSKHVCRSWQTLYFPSRILRYIRVVGTWSSVGQYFHLITFKCLYTQEKFKIEQDLIVSCVVLILKLCSKTV